jgi:hypothetical protein
MCITANAVHGSDSSVHHAAMMTVQPRRLRLPQGSERVGLEMAAVIVAFGEAGNAHSQEWVVLVSS